MRVETRVQHHPDRARLVRPLLARLPRSTVVVLDPDPANEFRSPLRTYVEALRLPPAVGTTHVLVVQDDAWPCFDFENRMLRAVEEKPDALVVLFAPGAGQHRRTMTLAHRAGDRWARLRSTWVPTVALVWPVEHARAFVEFVPSRYDPWTKHRGDDAPVGYWAGRAKADVWATVPSLVEHPDVEPSLIGRPNSGGNNRARIAAIAGD